MRAILVFLLSAGCTATPAKGDNDDADPAAADAESKRADGSTDHSVDANSTDGGEDDVSNADGGPPPVPTAYREPDMIRGGACADAAAATDACGGDSAEAVYCSLEDPERVIMAVCLSTSRGNQCEAMDDCGPGWSACTATQYVERGGRDVQPSFSTTNRAWLAACVQDAGGRTLRNEPCSPCTDFDPAYDPAVMWWCEDGSVVYEGGMDGDRLGVVTSPECFRVGENSPNNDAWWALDFASSGPPFVVCCDDRF